MLVGNEPGAQSWELVVTGIIIITTGALMTANITGAIANVF